MMSAPDEAMNRGDDAAAPEAASEPKYPGKGFRLGEYILQDRIGQGAMATVYSATDSTGHEVAIKIFMENSGVSVTMLERFRREAEATKKLRRHPHILTVYATGKEGPYHYIAMENIRRSKTLEDAVESASLSIPECVAILVKVARALHYAHNRRIVHRDVKPRNILIDEFGEPRLADFGVAALADWPSVTVTGALTGTPLYMSPEQARIEKPGPASDIYSLGTVLYEALTGVLPYQPQHGAPIRDVLRAVTTEEPRHPRLFRKDISPDLEAVILKALEKDPDDRYPDMEAFAVDLERAVTGRPVSARHFSPLDHVRYRLHRHRSLVMSVAAILLLAGGVYAYYERQIRDVYYANLLDVAQLLNTVHRLSPSEFSPETQRHTTRAWQELRIARNALHAGDWSRAQLLLQSTLGISLATGDLRTAAIAQLDLARCLLMQYDVEQALSLYEEIADSADASPIVRSFAQMEFLLVALLRGEQSRAVRFLARHPRPPEGPFRDALFCLGGEMRADTLLARMAHMPVRLRNDLYVVAAVRYYLDGDQTRCLTLLRQAIQESRPASEWPAPYARHLVGYLGT